MCDSAFGREVLLRYRYRDGSLQAAMPMRVVADWRDVLVGWLAAGTEIMYWALPDGTDPRTLPLEERFAAPLTTAPRTWRGGGVLRVIPVGEPYQVIHFWDEDGEFAGWYVNLEAPECRSGATLDTVDWHLDLEISPSRVPRWKDRDEAEAAVARGHLGADDLATAERTGRAVIDRIFEWPGPIGDWRSFRPPDGWAALPLQKDWGR